MNQSRRIMIVEDEPTVRLVFRAALESNDFLLTTAEDGEAALRFQRQAPADLILLDLQMPGMGGMDVLKRLRDSGTDVPVVIVSAHDSVPNVVQAMRLGAVDFLSKPPTPAALRKVVADVLARRDERPAPILASMAKPGETPGTRLISEAKDALNRREFDRAEGLLHRAAEGGGAEAEAHYLIGVLREMHDDRDGAYLAYRAAMRADPHYEPAKLHLLKYFNDRLM